MIIEYEGVDISERVSIKSYVHESFAEEHGDILKIKFNDISALWDKWNPKEGDTISLTNEEELSGKMYVRRLIPEASTYTVEAASYPISMETKRELSWNGISLRAIANDIASRHGLTFESYGVSDHKFTKLRQRNESDLIFLEKIAVLCGCAFLVYDGRLVLYQESSLEVQKVKETMNISGSNVFRYEHGPKYTGCKVSDSNISYMTGKDGNVATEEIDVYIASKGEAQFFAENLLKYKNKMSMKGFFYTNSREVTAGTVFNITTAQANSFNGLIFVYRVRYTEGKVKVFFRKV